MSPPRGRRGARRFGRVFFLVSPLAKAARTAPRRDDGLCPWWDGLGPRGNARSPRDGQHARAWMRGGGPRSHELTSRRVPRGFALAQPPYMGGGDGRAGVACHPLLARRPDALVAPSALILLGFPVDVTPPHIYPTPRRIRGARHRAIRSPHGPARGSAGLRPTRAGIQAHEGAWAGSAVRNKCKLR